jgi:putative FmdB family regulatory protein
MALYDYACAGCGPFELRRPMAQAGDPAGCPGCGRAATRQYGAPAVSRIAAPLRAAMEADRRSAHEPARVTRTAGSGAPHHHPHGPSRPWMLGH